VDTPYDIYGRKLRNNMQKKLDERICQRIVCEASGEGKMLHLAAIFLFIHVFLKRCIMQRTCCMNKQFFLDRGFGE
jgi:hypothetical protein